MYDVIYLGSGHACWHGAVTLSAAGKKVAILDHDVAGGTCTNYGCDAKILLDGPFEFVEGLERYKPELFTPLPDNRLNTGKTLIKMKNGLSPKR